MKLSYIERNTWESTHKYGTAGRVTKCWFMVIRRMDYRILKLTIEYHKTKTATYGRRVSDPEFYFERLAEPVNRIGIRGQNLGPRNMRGTNLGPQRAYVDGPAHSPR